MHCLLFNVADESVTEGWRYKICERVELHKEELRKANGGTQEDAWVAQVKEDKQVHALIFCLLKKVMNPAVISLERAQTSAVAHHAADHARHTGNGLKEDDSGQPVALIHLLRVVVAHEVHASAENLAKSQRSLIFKSFGSVMILLDILNVLQLVDWVRHAVGLRVQDHLELGQRPEYARLVKELIHHSVRS